MNQPLWIKCLVAATFGLLAMPFGCSATAADQCTVGPSGDADCERVLGVAQGQAFCDNGTCRQKAPPPPGVGADGGEENCTSTQQCTLDNGGSPSICREPNVKPCVPLTNDLCTVVGDGWRNARNPIFVGVLLHKTILSADGSETPQTYEKYLERSVQLGEAEWLAATTGGLNLGGERRPIVAVYCNTKFDVETTKRAFDFVTLGLGAPAIIAEYPEDALAVVDDLKGRGTFVYLTEGGSEVIAATQKAPGQTFTSFPPLTYSVPLVADYVARLEQTIRAERGLAPTDKIKVAALGVRDQVDTEYLDQLLSTLSFNGATAKSQPSEYKEFDAVVAPGASVPDYVALAQSIASFAPDVIMTTEALNFHLWELPLIEAAWSTPAYRPRYITTEMAAFAHRYAQSVGGNEPLRKRVGGVALYTDSESESIMDDFLVRFEARFKEPNEAYSITGFDAFYSTAYGIAAALSNATQPNALKGTDIAQALLTRLVYADGAIATPLVPGKIASSLAVLQQGGKLDLVGTTGGLDWSPATGAGDSDGVSYCVPRDEEGALWIADSGLHYSYRAKTTTGDFLRSECQW